MGGHHTCKVMSCRSRKDPNRIYHRFPLNPERRKQWIKIIGQKSTEIGVSSRICSKHFLIKDYYVGGKKLIPTAVPALHLDDSTTLNDLSRNSFKRSKKSTKAVGGPISSQIKENQPSKHLGETVQPTIKLDTLKLKLASNFNKEASNIKIEEQPKGKKCNANSNVTIGKNITKNSNTSLEEIDSLVTRIKIGRENIPLNKRVSKLCVDATNPNLKIKPGETTTSVNVKTNYRSGGLNHGASTPPSLGHIDNKPLESLPKNHDRISNFSTDGLVNDHHAKSQKRSTKEIKASFSKSLGKSIDEKAKAQEILLNEMKPNNKTKPSESITEETAAPSNNPKTRTKRTVKKRKRLLSESESENDSDSLKSQFNQSKQQTNKQKVQPKIITKEINKSHSSMCSTSSKNLSEIEKTMVMQNKIQLLEKEAILDEKKIETFKKTLLAQKNSDLQILMDGKENELLLRMDSLYLEYDPRRICRLCLHLVERKEDLTPLFWPVKNHVLLSLIQQATNVEVEHEDGMPSSICTECVEEVRRADWLKRRTQKSNSMIKKFVALKQNQNQSISGTYQMYDRIKTDRYPIDEESQDVQIQDVFSLENSPVSIFDDMTIKEEQDELEDSKPYYELNTTYPMDVQRPGKSLRCKSCSRTFNHHWKLMVHERYCSKRFQCSECNKCFLTSTLYKRHRLKMNSCYCAEHLRYCSECDISFRRKWQLMFHVLRHDT
ncbi:uncharacterized protein LOC128995025 [Macrosteles quadrilineatus]|uniref:uncharacterized protein LOC128995025 n=1 Tax=Macrosteles quadrilineatus TaxID=74068 RepID=UPI0023E1D558|nr:uncharacterized protein LOC128995025 [Macrosteles quadrilineatus]